MDLTTTYMGLTLKHPLVPSASPLGDRVDSIRALEDAGAAAVVLPSLFEEQLEGESHILNHYLSLNANAFAEALNYYPEMDSYGIGPAEYLNLIRQAKEAVDMPIIASLNGASPGGWINFARRIEEAGADALELNIYYVVADPGIDGAEVEQIYLEIVKQVNRQISIPVAVKLGPYFSAMANMAQRMTMAGADALVLFNRFYQPDFDLDRQEVNPHLLLSTSDELLLPLRWVAILYGRIPADFAITSGVHTHEDVLKGLMAGAKVTMMASELLHNGIQRIADIHRELILWMEEHENRISSPNPRLSEPTKCG